MGKAVQGLVQAVNRIRIQAHLHGEIWKYLLAFRQNPVQEVIIKFIEQPHGGKLLFRKIHLVPFLDLPVVKAAHLLQLIVLFQIIQIAGPLRHLSPLRTVSPGDCLVGKVPEILPGEKAAAEIFMGRRLFVELFHIFDPAVPDGLVIEEAGITVQYVLVCPVIPGIAHPQHHRKILPGRRLHHPVQLFPGIVLVRAGGKSGLKFPPGHAEDNIVKTVRRNLGQLLVHMDAFTIPEIHHPVVGVIGGGTQHTRLSGGKILRRRKAGGESRRDHRRPEKGCLFLKFLFPKIQFQFPPGSVYAYPSALFFFLPLSSGQMVNIIVPKQAAPPIKLDTGSAIRIPSVPR